MSGFVHFRCSTPSNPPNSSANLCLYGSTCDSAPSPFDGQQFQFCACLPGYINDYTVFHLANCGVPDYALDVMCGVLALITAISCIYTITVLRRQRSRTRLILLLAIIQTILGLLLFAIVTGQKGHFQAASVFLIFFNVLMARIQVEATLLFAIPIFGVLRRPVEPFISKLRLTEVVNMVGNIILGILTATYAFDVDPSRYNSVMFVFMLFFPAMTMLLSLIMSYYTLSLHKSIIESGISSDSKLRSFRVRLEKMKLNNGAFFGFSSMLFAFPVVVIVLGSFPGQYILYFLMHTGVPGFLITAAYLLDVDAATDSVSGVSRSPSREHVEINHQPKSDPPAKSSNKNPNGSDDRNGAQVAIRNPGEQ